MSYIKRVGATGDFPAAMHCCDALATTLFFQNDPSNVGFCVNQSIEEGTQPYQRTGRVIQLKSLEIRGYIHWVSAPSGGTTADDRLRILVVYDKAVNGDHSGPIWSDVVKDCTSVGLSDWFSFYNMSNFNRFVILRDRLIALPWINGTTGAALSPPFGGGAGRSTIAGNGCDGGCLWTETIDLDGLTTVYNGTNATMNNPRYINSGGIFILVQSDDHLDDYILKCKSRLCFTNMKDKYSMPFMGPGDPKRHGILSNFCGFGGHGDPVHAVDAACQEHDEAYGRMQAAGQNPYTHWNNADEALEAKVSAITATGVRENVVSAGTRTFLKLKRRLAPSMVRPAESKANWDRLNTEARHGEPYYADSRSSLGFWDWLTGREVDQLGQDVEQMRKRRRGHDEL